MTREQIAKYFAKVLSLDWEWASTRQTCFAHADKCLSLLHGEELREKIKDIIGENIGAACWEFGGDSDKETQEEIDSIISLFTMKEEEQGQ